MRLSLCSITPICQVHRAVAYRRGHCVPISLYVFGATSRRAVPSTRLGPTGADAVPNHPADAARPDDEAASQTKNKRSLEKLADVTARSNADPQRANRKPDSNDV